MIFHKLAAVFLFCAVVGLGSAHPVAAQEAGELFGRPWWMGALSFTFSIFSFSTVAIGLTELAKRPKVFWMSQVLAGAFLAFALYMTDVGTVFFWTAVFAGLLMLITDVALLLVKAIAKRIAR